MYLKKIKLSLFIITVFIIILSIMNIQLLFSIKENKKEKFDENDMPIISNRIFYFKIGLSEFFTNHDNITSFNDEEFLQWIKKYVYIWPNYQDFCCKAMEKPDNSVNCSCDQINVVTSSCADENMQFFNEKRINTIEGTVGASKSNNCTMSILGNNYTLMKKTLSIKLSRPVEQVGSGSKKIYRITTDENITSFVLSKPLFISFNTNGLYRVVHEDVNNATSINEYEIKERRNAFAYYSSYNRPNHIYLQKIDNDENRNYFTDTDTNIFRSMNFEHRHPATLYYFNYKSEIKTSDINTNIINICINQNSYIRDFKNNSNIQIVTGNDNTSFVQRIIINKESNNKLQISVDDQIFYVPDEFEYFNTKFSKFDICITLGLDILNIVCYGTESVSRRNVTVCVRHNLERQISLKKQTLKDIIKDQAQNIYNYTENTLKDVMNLTCIPNYAKVAYKLGYNFNIY